MLPELELYFEASREFEAGQVDEELWVRALEIASGNSTGAKYQYIHLRVEALGKDTPRPPVKQAKSPGSISPIESRKPVKPVAQPPWRPGDGEAEFYAIAASEFDGNQRDEQTWQDALVLAKGSYRAARHHYICLRMDGLRAMAANPGFIEKAGA